MKSCKKCGQDNLDDAKFCSNCGEKFSNNTEIGNQKDLTDSKIERTNLPDDISGSDVQKKFSNDEKEESKTSTLEFAKVPPIKENNEIKSKFKKLDFKNKKNSNIIIGNKKDLTDSKIERTNLSDDISGSDVQKKVSNDEKKESKTSTLGFAKVPPIKENNEIKSKFKKLDFKNKKNRNIIIGVFAVVVILFIAIATSGTPVESIKLEYSDATLDLGTTGVLDVKITPDDATNKKITWTSSDTSVASVNEKGKIKAKKIGTTTITAKSSNGKTAKCNLSVVQPGPDFSTIYYTYLDSSYATLGSDESYIEIDTNPNDYDDYSDDDAIQGLLYTIEALDLPDSLIKEMSATRALDGRQSETYDDVTVSWSYHPDQGLEVLFMAN